MLLDSNKKVYFVDWSIILNASVFSCVRQGVPDLYLNLAMKMVFGYFKKLEVNKEDLIIFALDSKLGSWRREVISEYKQNRKAIRAKTGFDWNLIYADFGSLVENLKLSTPFHFIEIPLLESDDIIATGTRYYKDYEVIIISNDSDFEQLLAYKNVKIFSPKTKRFKVLKGSDRKIKRAPYDSLAKKIRREKSDNLITPINTLKEYEDRKLVVSLLNLPVDVEKKVIKSFDNLPEKIYDIEKFRFPNLKHEINKIYDNKDKDLVTYNDSFKKPKKFKTKINDLKVLF